MKLVATSALILFVAAGGLVAQSSPGSKGGASSSTASIQARLNSTTVDRVQFEQASLESALDFLGKRTDGVPFLILGGSERDALAAKPVTLSLRGVPAATLLKYLCDLSACEFRVENHAVLVGRTQDLATVDRLRRSNPKRASSGNAYKGLSGSPLQSLDLRRATLAAAVELLRKKTAEARGGRPVNFVVLEDREDREDPKAIPVATRPVTLQLNQVTALAALQYLTEMAGLGLRVDHNAVVIGTPESIATRPANKVGKGSAIARYLSAKTVDQVRFSGISVKDAVEAVRYYSRQAQGQGQGQGAALNVVDATGSPAGSFDLKLDDVSLADLVLYVTTQSGTRVRAEGMTLIFEVDPQAAARAEEKAKELTDSTTTTTTTTTTAPTTAPAPAPVPALPAGSSAGGVTAPKKPDEGLRFD